MIVGANNSSTDKDERYVNCMFLSRGVKADKSLAYYIIKDPTSDSEYSASGTSECDHGLDRKEPGRV